MAEFMTKKLGKEQFNLIVESSDPQLMLDKTSLKEKDKKQCLKIILFIKESQVNWESIENHRIEKWVKHDHINIFKSK